VNRSTSVGDSEGKSDEEGGSKHEHIGSFSEDSEFETDLEELIREGESEDDI
jgi:hypothetical protein